MANDTHPRHPKHLAGSKWSRVGDEFDFRHWEVSSFDKSSSDVVLFAVLDKSTKIRFPWRDLRDRDLWEPGWI